MNRKQLKISQIILLLLGLLSPIVAPAGARVCGHVMANLILLDTSHPVDPCVDALATMEAAVATVTNYVMTVGLPLAAASVLTLSLISLFRIHIISCQLLSFPPQTPPPKF